MKLDILIDPGTGALMKRAETSYPVSPEDEGLYINGMRLSAPQIERLEQQKGNLVWTWFFNHEPPKNELQKIYSECRTRDREERFERLLANTRRLCDPANMHFPKPRPSLWNRLAHMLPKPVMPELRLGWNSAVPIASQMTVAGMVVLAGALNLDFTKASAPQEISSRTIMSFQPYAGTTMLSPLPELCRVGEGSYRSLPSHFISCAQMGQEEHIHVVEQPAPPRDPVIYREALQEPASALIERKTRSEAPAPKLRSSRARRAAAPKWDPFALPSG